MRNIDRIWYEEGQSPKNILRQSFLCFASEDNNPVLKEEKKKI